MKSKLNTPSQVQMKTEIILKATQSDIVELLINEMREDLEAQHLTLNTRLEEQLRTYFVDADIVTTNLINGINVPADLLKFINKNNMVADTTESHETLMGFSYLPVKFISYGLNKLPNYGRDINGYIETRMDQTIIKELSEIKKPEYQRRGRSPFNITLPSIRGYADKDSKIVISMTAPYLKDDDRGTLVRYVIGEDKASAPLKKVIKWFKDNYGINNIAKELKSLQRMCEDIAVTMSELEAINHKIWDLQKNPGKYKARFTKASLQKSPEGQEILQVVDQLKSSDNNLLNS